LLSTSQEKFVKNFTYLPAPCSRQNETAMTLPDFKKKRVASEAVYLVAEARGSD
jgi:hypothetical protein